MIGLSEHQVFSQIEHGYSGTGHLSTPIERQKQLNPDDALAKLATGVAKAIEANNKAIEQQLRSAGIDL